MANSNPIYTSELRFIATALDAINNLPKGGDVSITLGDTKIHDANGELLGYIVMADSGDYAFFASEEGDE